MTPAARTLIALIACASACRDAPPAPPPAPPPPEPTVWHAGCAEVHAGPRCVLPDDRRVRLWAAEVDGVALRVEIDGGEAAAETRDVPDGRGWTVVVPEGARRLEVVAARAGAASRWVLPIGVEPHRMEPGRLDAGALPDEAARARSAGIRGRAAIRAGRYEDAVTAFEASIPSARAAGLVSAASRDSTALAYVLLRRLRRYDDTRRVLDAVEGLHPEYPEARGHVAYTRALMAEDLGDARTAMRHLEQAERIAARLGTAWQQLISAELRALILIRLGRNEEAIERLHRLLDGLAEDAWCDRSRLLSNLGRAQLGTQGARAGAARLREVRAGLERALEIAASRCPDQARTAVVRLNLAIVALKLGQVSVALEHLEAAAAQEPARSTWFQVWLSDLRGRAALARGAPEDALRAFERAARLAEGGLDAAARWRAALGRGRAQQALGQPEAAIAAFEHAEQILLDEALGVPADAGRGAFVGEREASAEALVELLVGVGRAEQAMQVARRARARVLLTLRRAHQIEGMTAAQRARWEGGIARWRTARAALEQAAEGDWRLSGVDLEAARHARARSEAQVRAHLEEALSALAGPRTRARGLESWARPPAGTVRLTWFPAGEGWIGLAATGSRVRSVRLPALSSDAAARSRALLEPFEAELVAADRIELLPHGDLRALDLATARIGGGTLLSHAPISWPLDLGGAPPPDARGGVLLVADPRSDLPAARREADRVAPIVQRVTRQGGIRRLTGPAATGEAVRRALADVHWFHYAGHGVYAGTGGWESHLPLAGGGSLSVADILALPRVPSRVVLSGCETARSARSVGAEGLGLAQAFVAAGASDVVAAVRPVNDALAADLSEALYRHLAADAERGGVSVPAALRLAQLEIAGSAPTSDWAAFRAVSF